MYPPREFNARYCWISADAVPFPFDDWFALHQLHIAMVALKGSFTGNKAALTTNAAYSMKRRVMARRGGAVSVEARRVAVLGAGPIV